MFNEKKLLIIAKTSSFDNTLLNYFLDSELKEKFSSGKE